MALSFPLARAAFFDLLPIAAQSFDLPEAVEVSRTGGGVLIGADVADRLWQGTIRLGRMTVAEARPALALINALRGPGRGFLLADAHRLWPQADPGGLIVAGFSPAISAVAGDLRTLSLSGLPAGYVLSPGDLIGWSHGAAPVRHALHEIVSGGTASGAGALAALELTPALRPGTATGTPVSLVRPVCEAVIVPGSVNPGNQSRLILDNAGFDWRQTLR